MMNRVAYIIVSGAKTVRGKFLLQVEGGAFINFVTRDTLIFTIYSTHTTP